jgi:hypothetical protein
MNANHAALVTILAAVAFGCGGAKAKQAAPASGKEARSQGFTKDDKARCEFQGRADRDVSEATAAGAMSPNIRRVYQIVGEGAERRKVLICREVDTNLDGVKDVVRTFNEKGEPLREEADSNYDGKVDTWISFANGRIAKETLDQNGDGKPDQWKYYVNGRLSRIQRDTNADGNADVWEIYVRDQLERVGVDVDKDGRVDRWDRDEVGRLATATRESESSGQAKSGGADAGAAGPASGGAEGAGADAGAKGGEAAGDAGAAPGKKGGAKKPK